MNILGHSYIATQAISGNKELLIVGSLLPESFPFISGNPFSNEEIHEGGEKLLQFLEKNYPHKRDLAPGVLAHSRKFGADGWNKEIEKYAGDQREALLDKIAEASRVDAKTAELRLHNFLWWGVDFLILKNKPEFVDEVAQVLQRVDVEEVSKLLAECFGKDYKEVQKTMRFLFREIYQPEDLNSVEGLARIWARQAAGLPEHDRADVEETAGLIEEMADLMKNDFKELLKLVVAKTRNNLKQFLLSG